MSLRNEEQPRSIHDAPGITPLREAPDVMAVDDIATAGTQTFARLRALVGKGYRPDFEKSNDECLLLVHPQKRFKYREMLLDSSGTAQWLHDEDYTTHFSRWEKRRFDIFLRCVPAPGWWDRTRGYRERVYAFVIGALVCVVIYIVVVEAMSLAYGFFGGE
jgi:hypothetical protein